MVLVVVSISTVVAVMVTDHIGHLVAKLLDHHSVVVLNLRVTTKTTVHIDTNHTLLGVQEATGLDTVTEVPEVEKVSLSFRSSSDECS